MEFSSIIADASAFASGAFGTLALLVDHKDRVTGKITWGGKLALCGIAISVCLSVGINYAQRKEAENTEERQRFEIARLTSVAENSARRLEQITTELDGGSMRVVLKLSCSSERFRRACMDKRRYYNSSIARSPNTNRFLPESHKRDLEVGFAIGTKPQDSRMLFLAVEASTSPMSWDVSGHGTGRFGFDYLLADFTVEPLKVKMANGIPPTINEIKGRVANFMMAYTWADDLVYFSISSRNGATVSSKSFDQNNPKYVGSSDIQLSDDYGSKPIPIDMSKQK